MLTPIMTNIVDFDSFFYFFGKLLDPPPLALRGTQPIMRGKFGCILLNSLRWSRGRESTVTMNLGYPLRMYLQVVPRSSSFVYLQLRSKCRIYHNSHHYSSAHQ